MVGPTLEEIHSTLVSAFDGYKLSSGAFLTASNTRRDSVSGGALPFLSFDTGSFTMSPWKDFVDQITWDIPATLTVQGPAEDGEVPARMVIQDLILRTKQIIGLPLDDKGNLVPLSQETLRLFDAGKLKFLTERGAPYLKSAQVISLQDGMCTAKIVFHVEATMSLDTRKLRLMKVGVLGVNTVRPSEIFQDSTDGRGVALVFGTPDERGFGGYASGDPTFPYATREPLQPGGTKSVQGVPASDQVVEVNVTPYAVAISSGTPTAQLSAIAKFNNWATRYVTSGGSWLSDDPTVATVDAAGLVTRVGSGTCNITCTYGGTASNAVPVTSS